MTRFPYSTLVTVLLAFIVVVPLAHATLLNPGQCVGNAVSGCDFTSGVQNFNNATPGTVIADTGVQSYAITLKNNIKESGNFEEQVIKAAGTGYLSFYYQFSLTGPKGGQVDTLEASDFTGWLTDVGTNKKDAVFTGNNGTGSPSSINVTPDGTTVNFEFGNSFTLKNSNPLTSVSLVVNTNAFSYQAGSVGLIDSGVATLNGFAPGPEPGTMMLFGSVLVVGAFLARRRLVRR